MIDCREFLSLLHNHELSFFAGVPDSLLKDFCACLSDHDLEITCANEGNAVGLVAGYHLATGKIGVCYLQNAGLGNSLNPLISLTHSDVYAIPLLLLVGWRGEPGTDDEPQHIAQGKITLPTLDLLGIDHSVLSPEPDQAAEQVARAVAYMSEREAPYALIVGRDIFREYATDKQSELSDLLTREAALRVLVSVLPPDARTVATTGKLSRELFELRASSGQSHAQDFLTIGSMGHASSIALGLALHRPERPVFCLDGDGAALMHLGALATIGSQAPPNFHHIIFNNGVHDSVGGQATAGPSVDFPAIARACGYCWSERARTADDIQTGMNAMLTTAGPTMLEILVKRGSRKELGRPARKPTENKQEFMSGLS